MGTELLPKKIQEKYEIHEWKHACAVLKEDFPLEWNDIITVLDDFSVLRSHILAGGGGKSQIASSLDGKFTKRGWKEKKFDTKVVVDDDEKISPTHKVDCFKNGVALEIEWNNKDPFYDRDLNNFRLLFDLRAISVGIIVTKSNALVDPFKKLGTKIWDKYGMSTTWMSKLLPRIEGGGGGGCPILVFGITPSIYVED